MNKEGVKYKIRLWSTNGEHTMVVVKDYIC